MDELTPEIGPDDNVNPEKNVRSLCTGCKEGNIFFVPRAPGYPGKCVLDELTYGQVFRLLQTVPRAKMDLLRITNDPILVSLANETRLEKDELEDDKVAADLINKKGTLPFYTVFKGSFP